MRIALLTDSGCGIKDEEIKNLGIHILHLKFSIDDIEYEEMEEKQFFEKLKNAKSIHTSQPSIEDLEKSFEDILKYYDNLIYIPISSGLSGTYGNAKVLSNDDRFKDRVYVVDSKKVSVTQRFALLDTIKLIDKGYNAKEIMQILEKYKYNTSIYILLDTLEYLKRGGRVNPLVAGVGEILKIKPILYSDGGSFDSFKKIRQLSQAKEVLINAVLNDMKEKFKCDEDKISIGIAYTNDDREALKFKEIIKERFKGIARDIPVDALSKTVSCHIGPNALGIGIYKNIDES